MSFTDVVTGLPGLTRYYPLTANAQDALGSAEGANNGATFTDKGATFDGTSFIDLGDSGDFSVATTGGLTIAVFLTITDWRGAEASEYVHWMGKGEVGKHEWTFRHYVKGGSGESSTRQGRLSFYHFNPNGGLGAGSYYEDSICSTTERLVVATVNSTKVAMSVDGVKRDEDTLSGYSVTPVNSSARVRLGTRDMSTGFLVGTARRLGFWNRVLTDAEIGKLWAARAETDATPATTATTTATPTTTESDGFIVPTGATQARS